MTSLQHLAAIHQVLKTFGGGSDRRSIARAMVVVEDVAVCLHLGIQCGLTLDQVVSNHAEILRETVGATAGCICDVMAADGDVIPIGQSIACPEHPGRTFARGPSGMAS